MGEAAAGLLSRTFFGGAGCSWSLIGKMRPDATIHWRMCTLNVQRVVGRRCSDPGGKVSSREKKRRKTKSSDGRAGRGVICTRAGARWPADVCKDLVGESYSLLCSWASGRNEVRARGWHGQAMDKKAGRGEGGECEDARDAAAENEMAWNGAARWHAGTWRARGRMRQSKREDDKQEEGEREGKGKRRR